MKKERNKATGKRKREKGKRKLKKEKYINYVLI